ncbi:hypothetical protein [Alteraurantiacibacter palmitatis]|uniref:Energy transducer TonB n=1 Tax=Alteraurantiacibacter palmitatis TaxID=2054628 RepID=A0ABV7EA18_9SPHN
MQAAYAQRLIAIFPGSVTLPASLRELRQRLGAKGMGLALALLLEALLLLMLLSLGTGIIGPGSAEEALVSVQFDRAEDADTPAEEQPAAEEAPQAAPPVPLPAAPVEQAAPPLPSALPLPRPQSTPTPLTQPVPTPQEERRRPDAPSGSTIGVRLREEASGPAAPARSTANDSAVVGTAPDGSPLYAARWYKEPTDQEMAGYLSTAQPGMALIACRTAPGWRVEDCVGLEEYPAGSNMMRAVLAMAWQFQVRPPRRGDDSLVGSWVRIRIDYSTRRRG